MTKETYKKLIDYVYQTCNVVEFKKYTSGHVHFNQRIISAILNGKPKNLNISDKKECIDSLYDLFKDDCFIFDYNYKKQYETNNLGLNNEFFQKLIQKDRRSVIESSVFSYIYDLKTNNFLFKNKDDFISANEDIKKIGDYDNSYYHFKLSENLKKELTAKNTIYDWKYPLTLEDICFFKKDGVCLFWSISHEEIYEICFQENEETEYEYLKSIGIEFVEEKFTPTPKEDLYYLEEDFNK